MASRIIIIVVFCLFTFLAFAQINIHGVLQGVKEGKLYVNYLNSYGTYVNDSCEVINESFQLKLNTNETTQVTIKLFNNIRKVDDPNMGELYLDTGYVSLKIKPNNFKFIETQGSRSQKYYEEIFLEQTKIRQENKETFECYEKLKALFPNENEFSKNEQIRSQLDSLKSIVSNISKQINSIPIRFIQLNPHLELSALLLYEYGYALSIDSVRSLYESFSEVIKRKRISYLVYSKILKVNQSKIGSVVQDFGFQYKNKMLRLSELVSIKPVVIIFWASWCLPCREDNKAILKFYKNESTKYTIITVSIDESLNNWQKAIREDKIDEWINVHVNQKFTDTTKSFKNIFDIPFVPITYLITKENIIFYKIEGYRKENIELLRKEIDKINFN